MTQLTELWVFFVVYAFLGWVIETAFAYMVEKRFVNRGFLTGPFCPIYGFGAMLIISSFEWIDDKLPHNLVTLAMGFVFSVIMVTVLEYITGLLLEKIFHCKWWDYSQNKWNLKGYVCFKYSILWGTFACLLVLVIHPNIAMEVHKLSGGMLNNLAIIFLIYFAADTVKTTVEALKLRTVLLFYTKFSESVYYDRIVKYQRFFLAFPRLLMINADIVNRDIRSILNDRLDKIKGEFKSRFL